MTASRQSATPTAPLTLAAIRAHVFRTPLAKPVATSFGIMRERAAVILEVEDRDGAVGYGEIWCNFPSCGAEHRARLAALDLGPLALGRTFAHPSDGYRHMTAATRILAIQAAEPGPFAQVIGGLDMALWDLAARKAGVPVCRLLADDCSASVPAYASGIDVRVAPELIERAAGEGYRAFKIKVGFQGIDELRLIHEARAAAPAGTAMMADANQGWTLEGALAFVRQQELPQLGWLEEPLAADAPEHEWRVLAGEAPMPLAAGENMLGDGVFEAAIQSRTLGVLQPDMAKWGGFSGCFPVARAAIAAGLTYCPHYLGGGVGLLASAHLLAAAGGPGLLEVDVNPNPLRTALYEPVLDPSGHVVLPRGPGLGIVPDLAALAAFRSATFETSPFDR
ncbi:MAG: mandelate racemase/muconate lactonizing enzyme family protein [Hyphomicrobiaceae bacterium]